jgi:AcrR family transcriptional regulator
MRALASSQEKKQAADGRHEILLQGLEEIFLGEGFRRVTIAELAARLQCSRRSLYELAESKEALFLAVLGRVLSRIERGGRAAAATAKAAGDKIPAFIEPGLTELRNATSSFFADIASYPPAAKRLRDHQAVREQELCALIERGVRSGQCRRIHAEVAACALLAAYRAITEPAFLSNVDVSLREAVEEARDLFLYGLLHPDD